MIDDLVRLSGFHPSEITPSHVGMYVRLEVASGYPPVSGKRQGQEVAKSEQKIIGRYVVLDLREGHFGKIFSASIRKYKDVFSGAGSEQMLTPFGPSSWPRAALSPEGFD